MNPLLIYHNLIQNPKSRWPTIIVTALYIFSPFDISPDFLPVLGQIDDGILLVMFLVEMALLFLGSRKKANPNSNSNSTQKGAVVDGEYEVKGK